MDVEMKISHRMGAMKGSQGGGGGGAHLSVSRNSVYFIIKIFEVENLHFDSNIVSVSVLYIYIYIY